MTTHLPPSPREIAERCVRLAPQINPDIIDEVVLRVIRSVRGSKAARMPFGKVAQYTADDFLILSGVDTERTTPTKGRSSGSAKKASERSDEESEVREQHADAVVKAMLLAMPAAGERSLDAYDAEAALGRLIGDGAHDGATDLDEKTIVRTFGLGHPRTDLIFAGINGKVSESYDETIDLNRTFEYLEEMNREGFVIVPPDDTMFANKWMAWAKALLKKTRTKAAIIGPKDGIVAGEYYKFPDEKPRAKVSEQQVYDAARAYVSFPVLVRTDEWAKDWKDDEDVHASGREVQEEIVPEAPVAFNRVAVGYMKTDAPPKYGGPDLTTKSAESLFGPVGPFKATAGEPPEWATVAERSRTAAKAAQIEAKKEAAKPTASGGESESARIVRTYLGGLGLNAVMPEDVERAMRDTTFIEILDNVTKREEAMSRAEATSAREATDLRIAWEGSQDQLAAYFASATCGTEWLVRNISKAYRTMDKRFTEQVAYSNARRMASLIQGRASGYDLLYPDNTVSRQIWEGVVKGLSKPTGLPTVKLPKQIGATEAIVEWWADALDTVARGEQPKAPPVHTPVKRSTQGADAGKALAAKITAGPAQDYRGPWIVQGKAITLADLRERSSRVDEWGPETVGELVPMLNALTFPLHVYRGMNLPRGQTFDPVRAADTAKGSWTWRREVAEHWARGTHENAHDQLRHSPKDGTPLVIEAVVESPQDIDWTESLDYALGFTRPDMDSTEGEFEVRVLRARLLPTSSQRSVSKAKPAKAPPKTRASKATTALERAAYAWQAFKDGDAKAKSPLNKYKQLDPDSVNEWLQKVVNVKGQEYTYAKAGVTHDGNWPQRPAWNYLAAIHIGPDVLEGRMVKVVGDPSHVEPPRRAIDATLRSALDMLTIRVPRPAKATPPADPAAHAVGITPHQRELLEGIATSDYDRPVWTWSAVEGIPEASRGGVVAKAVEAGLVTVWGEGQDSTIDMTPAGEAALAAARKLGLAAVAARTGR